MTVNSSTIRYQHQHKHTQQPVVAIRWTGDNLSDVETFLRAWIAPAWGSQSDLPNNGNTIRFVSVDGDGTGQVVRPGEWIVVALVWPIIARHVHATLCAGLAFELTCLGCTQYLLGDLP